MDLPADGPLLADRLVDQRSSEPLSIRDAATDTPRKDQALAKDSPHAEKSPKADLPLLLDKPVLKDLLPKDLLPKDKPLKIDVKVDSKRGEPTGFNPNGTYTIVPQVTYKCAFNVVSFTIDWATLVDSGSTLAVNTGPTGPKGGCSVLMGDTAFDGSFTASCTYAGSCNETYTLTGAFTGNNFSGTYLASFTGSCLNCVNQSWNITGTRQ